MGEHSFNLSEFIRRSGLKRVSEFPITERVQPVVQVGDLSSLVPAYAPPTALAGRFVAAVAAQTGAVSAHSLAPGGMFILLLSVQGGTVYVFGLTPTDPGLLGVPIVHQMSNETSQAVIRDGTIAAPPITNLTSPTVPSGQLLQGAPLYVPRGQFFVAAATVPLLAISYSIIAIDVPASEGAA